MSKLWDQFCDALRWSDFMDGWLAVGYAANGLLVHAVRIHRNETSRNK